ncbi:4-(cytidine 5'-diphospho)-2-C-methyl-D-erythritol kinase [Dermacoccaceae bacterium W4C1]
MVTEEQAQVIAVAPGKINLDLRVGPLRPDGFHGLSTVYHAVDLYDRLRITPASDWSVRTEGDWSEQVPTGGDNLVLRAAQLLAVEVGPTAGPVEIVIEKAIPVAAGMAGGSADAAATLVGCQSLWGAEVARPRLEELAAELGSDVPFLLTGGTALGSGRGEQVLPVLTQGQFHWVLAIHREGLPTPSVFAELDRLRAADGRDVAEASEPTAQVMAALRSGQVDQLGSALANDLEEAALELLPRLSETRDAGLRHGAVAALVSGSGPTLAFLTRSHAAALDLMVALSADGVADEVVHARGPVAGAHVVREIGCPAI